MLFDITAVRDYSRDVAPFLRNGILLDTSVFKEIVDGIVTTRFERKTSSELQMITDFLDRIKLTTKWNKFVVTPHILTEICRHFHNDYCRRRDYKKIVEEIFPMLNNMIEAQVSKDQILNYIDFSNPIIEIGDISIFVVADGLISNRSKVAILSKDYGFLSKYKYDKNVMVMDYRINTYNSY